jgi:hypothetical protein
MAAPPPVIAPDRMQAWPGSTPQLALCAIANGKRWILDMPPWH